MSASLQRKQYWATLKGPALVEQVRLKVKRYFEACEQQGLIDRWRDQYDTYFMQVGNSTRGLGRANSTKLDLGTRKKPDIKIQIPETRSLIVQQKAFILAEPISFQVVSTTGSTRSVMGSEVGEKAVNYVYAERIKPTLNELVTHADIYGAAASHLRWNAKLGDDVIETHQVVVTDEMGNPVPKQSMTDPVIDPNTGEEVEPSKPRFDDYGVPVPVTDDEGNVVPETRIQKSKGKSGAPFRDALDPTMFAYDPRIGPKANWVVAFEWTNLYILAKTYASDNPELADRILSQNCVDEFESYRLGMWQDKYGADEGDIMIMHFYYADSVEVPGYTDAQGNEIGGGRHVVIIGDLDIDLGPCPLPAGRLPVRLILNDKYTDCYLSFANSSAVTPIEQALNNLRSSELRNFAYFGDQVRFQENTTKLISGEGQGRREQKVLQGPRGSAIPVMLPINAMPNTGPLKEDLTKAIPRTSGMGDVSRGTIEDTTSGAHAAVFEAITARNLSLPQEQIVTHETEVANDTLVLMQNFGNVEFIIEIGGKNGAPLARSFAPEDFGTIRRLVAKAVPESMRGPLARTKLVEITKDIQDPREAAKARAFILRGDDEYGKNDERCQNLISIENEWLLSGEFPVTASILDDGYAHCVDHKAAFDEYRTQPNADPEVLMRFQQHIADHEAKLEDQDPVVARMLGYQEPPVLPGKPSFVFQQRLLEAQKMLNPQPMPGDEPDSDDKPQGGEESSE